MYTNWQRGWNGILDEMTLLLHKLSIDPSIVLLSHGRASPLGLAARGAGRLVGPDAGGGLVSGMGSFWKGLDFLEVVAIRYYYQKIITKQLRITPQRRRAHRDLTVEDGTISGLTILAGFGLASPGSLSTRGSCPGRCPRLMLLGPPCVGLAVRVASRMQGRQRPTWGQQIR